MDSFETIYSGKQCRLCNVWKLLSDFHKNKTMRDGHINQCKACRSELDARRHASLPRCPKRQRIADERYYQNPINREKTRVRNKQWRSANGERRLDSRRRYLFGIGTAQWESLFDAQGRVCGICQCVEPGAKQGWSTDHDHATGKVRGILCHQCNLAIGYYEKRLLPRLDKMLEYLHAGALERDGV
jgi:hypothetical protein